MLAEVLKLEDFNFTRDIKNKDEVTIKLTDLKSVIEQYNNNIEKLVNRINELEYWKKIDKRIADLDAGNGKVMTLEESIKYAEKKAKEAGIEL